MGNTFKEGDYLVGCCSDVGVPDDVPGDPLYVCYAWGGDGLGPFQTQDEAARVMASRDPITEVMPSGGRHAWCVVKIEKHKDYKFGDMRLRAAVVTVDQRNP
jgi:hypothetical protein